jgi:hypothetical protein
MTVVSTARSFTFASKLTPTRAVSADASNSASTSHGRIEAWMEWDSGLSTAIASPPLQNTTRPMSLYMLTDAYATTPTLSSDGNPVRRAGGEWRTFGSFARRLSSMQGLRLGLIHVLSARAE